MIGDQTVKFADYPGYLIFIGLRQFGIFFRNDIDDPGEFEFKAAA
jgi:hypothetical protein